MFQVELFRQLIILSSYQGVQLVFSNHGLEWVRWDSQDCFASSVSLGHLVN